MKFYPRRRRSAPAIIIISLIDVLLVMLVFLLFTTTLKNTPAVKLELPESSETARAGASQEKPPLVLSIRRETPRFFLGERPVPLDQLSAELRTSQQRDPTLRLVLRADRESEWGDVVKVLDLAKQASITNVKAYTKGKAP
jgi:biopolymer transport protein ExbD